MSKTSDKSLATAILIAGVLTASALTYVGMQLAARPDEARVLALIEERLAQPAATAATANEATKETVRKPELSDKEFNARIEKGIIAFVEKQRHAEQDRPTQLAKNVPAPSKTEHVYGNPEAQVSLIEYSDFECPYCKTVHATAKRLVDESKGQVNWVYRHFPLEMHNPGAQKQAEASECAAELGGNDVFWKFTDAIYTRTRSGGKGFPLENLGPLAVEVGLDKAAFEQCLSSGKYAHKIQQHMESALRAGISGTPGNVLYDGKTRSALAMHGAQPYERFRDAAAIFLGKAKQ